MHFWFDTIDCQVLQLASLQHWSCPLLSSVRPPHFRLTVATSLGESAVQIPDASHLIQIMGLSKHGKALQNCNLEGEKHGDKV